MRLGIAYVLNGGFERSDGSFEKGLEAFLKLLDMYITM